MKAAIGTDLMAAAGAPKGIGVSVAGMLTNSNPGMYGMVLGFSTPAGKRVDPNQSGSWKSKGSSNYDMMRVVVVDDASVKLANTEYWEVWYTQGDVDSDKWSTEVSMFVDSSEYSFVFTKKSTGDGFDDEVTDAKLEPSGYDRQGE
ncbi:MAG: hypothetical protein KDC00_05475 [Flavobacteriales bacterium]|nr:hypothetical protein [Flavobacteriales bacterium]